MFALLIYRLLFLLLLPLLLAALLLRSRTNYQYRQRLAERMGFIPKPVKKGGIIIHAASVGEVIALTPFVTQLLQSHPELPITLTTFTPTGSIQVQKTFGVKVQHSYLPLDLFPCTQLFLSRLQPKIMIFMETELWPNMIQQCANKKIKLLLINARLSQNSVTSYQKLSPLIKPILNCFDKILCQSEESFQRFLFLGRIRTRCEVSGNLKFDICNNVSINTKIVSLRKLLPENRQIWLVASSHDGDEEIALTAFSQIKQQFPNLLLVLVPRHPERFQLVAQLCQAKGFNLMKRSDNIPVINQDIWLLDTLGELMPAYALASIVTMGGSFSDIGGHNPLEPALFKKPIVVGNDMSNFSEVLTQLQQQKGIVQLPSASNAEEQSKMLSTAVLSLLQNSEQATVLGLHAYQVVIENQGASKRTLAAVEELLNETS